MKKEIERPWKKSCVGDFTFYNEWGMLQSVERIFSNVISKLLHSILEYFRIYFIIILGEVLWILILILFENEIFFQFSFKYSNNLAVWHNKLWYFILFL